VSIIHDLEKIGFNFELPATNVNDAIRRAINQYGAEAVKEAVKQQTTAKRGRPAENDGSLFLSLMELDAREWLDGADPKKNRSNYSIATAFSDKQSGHSRYSTSRRLQAKLKRHRVLRYLFEAVDISREGYSYKKHLRALEALADVFRVPSNHGELARTIIAEFESRFGQCPPDNMSLVEIQKAVLVAQNAGQTSHSSDAPTGLGAAPNYRP
jgi:hypothetical protein